jgi:hypothetical protein
MATVYFLYCGSGGFKSTSPTVTCVNGRPDQIAVDTAALQTPESTPVPSLDKKDVASVFSVGFSVVVLCFVVGRSIGSVLSLIRKG